MTKQLEIDFTRCVRVTWVEKVILPAYEREFPDGTVQKARTAPIKTLLRVLESHARDGGTCRLKRSTIATEMGVSERTASRVIGDAEQLGVVLVLKRSLTKLAASEYAINWTTLKEWLLERPETARLVDKNAPLTGYDEPAVRRIQFVAEDRLAEAAAVVEVEEEEDVGMKRGCQTPFLKAEKVSDTDADEDHDNGQSHVRFGRTETTQSPGTTCHSPGTNQISPETTLQSPGTNLQGDTTGRTTYSRVRVLNHVLNHEKPFKESFDGSDFSVPKKDNSRNGSACYGWPFLIQQEHLKKMGSLMELWKCALGKNWGLSDSDRIRFFTLATSIARKHDEHTIKRCGAAFTSQLRESIKTGIWPGNAADEQIATNALRAYDLALKECLKRVAGSRR